MDIESSGPNTQNFPGVQAWEVNRRVKTINCVAMYVNTLRKCESIVHTPHR